MSKTSIITRVKCCAPFENKKFGGQLFPHLLQFENGDVGCINKKEPNSKWLAVGKELTYEDVGKVRQDGKEYMKIKEDRASFGGGGDFGGSASGGAPASSDKEMGMRIGNCMHVASRLVASGTYETLDGAAIAAYDAVVKLEAYAKGASACIPAGELDDCIAPSNPEQEVELEDDDLPF